MSSESAKKAWATRRANNGTKPKKNTYAYKGEASIGKTLARAKAYGKINNKRLRSMYHIVIASRMCGDIRFLLAHGVPKHLIIACDIDAIARANARALGVIISPYPSIEETVAWAFKTYGKANIASINCDLCGGVDDGAEVMLPIMMICDDNNYVGHIFYTFSRRNAHLPGLEKQLVRFFQLTSIGKPNSRTRTWWEKNGDCMTYNSVATKKGSSMCQLMFGK